MLQQLDLEMDETRQKLTDDAEKLAKLTTEAQQKKDSLDQSQAQLKQIETEKRDFEGTLKLEEQRLNKSKTRLKTLKTQYEFQALQREIDTTKRANEELEETILKKMEELESLKKVIEDLETSYEVCEKARAEFETEAKSREPGLQESLAKQEAESKAALEAVDPPVLSKYRFIRKRRPGTALVPIENGSCQGCFMALPPQQVNEMMQKGTFDQCPNCSRMIYVPDPEPSE